MYTLRYLVKDLLWTGDDYLIEKRLGLLLSPENCFEAATRVRGDLQKSMVWLGTETRVKTYRLDYSIVSGCFGQVHFP